MKFSMERREKGNPKEKSFELSREKIEYMFEVLRGELMNVDPKERATALDFQGLPPGSTEKNMLGWIKKQIDISPKLIEDNKKTPESKQAYNNLNKAYKRAKNLLRNTLKYSEAEVSVGPPSLSSKDDLMNLLKQTVLVKGKQDLGLGLGSATAVCRLVKTTIVAYETLKHDAEILKEITKNFENALLPESSEVANAIDAPLVFVDDDEGEKVFYASDDDSIEGAVSSRGKDLEKAMLRYINRPESSAESALKDGIASRITIESKMAIGLLPILSKWLMKSMGVRFLNIENKQYFSEEEMKKAEHTLSNSLSKHNFYLSNAESSKISSGDFRGLIIKGTLGKDSLAASASSSNLVRQFEIQIVDPENENEKGRNHHSVYDVVKLVAARTRLSRGCPKSVFNEFVKDASYESGMSEEEIRGYLLESFEDKDAPISEVKRNQKKNGEKWYIADSVYERWAKFGWADPYLLHIEIKKSKEEGQKGDIVARF